jgi:hypothetical protein
LGFGGLFCFGGGGGEGLGTGVDLGGGGATRPASSASSPPNLEVSIDAETSTVAKRNEVKPWMKCIIKDTEK